MIQFGFSSCRFQFSCGLLIALVALVGGRVWADEVRVAVASNFSATMAEIVERFERESGHRVSLVFGSTGKLYAQIRHGAPFDAFFAADARRPALLEGEAVAIPESRFVYAVGRLALWSPKPDWVDGEGAVLRGGDFRHLALANPKLAPYGRAARQVLQKLGLWAALRGRMVRGENVGQAFQFVVSGNAALGFVAYSQIVQADGSVRGSFWMPDATLYDPIEQQAVLLRESPAARALLDFTRSDKGRAIIRRHGYGLP